MGIDLAMRSLSNPGDVCVFEEPTYYLSFQMARNQGATYIWLPLHIQHNPTLHGICASCIDIYIDMSRMKKCRNKQKIELDKWIKWNEIKLNWNIDQLANKYLNQQ